MITKRTFYLYATAKCPYCFKAKALLTKKKHKFITMELDWEHETLRRLKEEMDWPTVPMIFEIEGRDHKFVGGYDDLVTYLKGKENE